MKEKIFIYGLFRDQAKTLLNDYTSFGIHSVKGDIFKVNEFYPGFVDGSGMVFGELVEVEHSVLPQLDEYEGDEYERVKLKTTGGIECWIYKYKYSVDGFKKIKSGDWMLR
jgi:gamma-glutamylcyclotransferase (GGCT)/AIG2-like uncharacterized protein YtfP